MAAASADPARMQNALPPRVDRRDGGGRVSCVQRDVQPRFHGGCGGSHEDDDVSEQDDIRVIRAFHTLLEARDVPGLLALATDDIGIGGGRGRGEGKEFFAEWVRYATISLTPRRWFRQVTLAQEGRHGMPGQFASTVVVEEEAVWRSAQSGREMGRMRFGTIYDIENGSLKSIARYPDIGEAVTTAGFYPEYEVDPTDE